MGITNTYQAFCFNEACLHIDLAWQDEKTTLRFAEDKVNMATGKRKTFQSEVLKL
ncbi:hypothetical protein [Faecalimicrobium sp. JNUCC 81]